MPQPTIWARAFEQGYLRPMVRRFKKITGIGRISAVGRRVDQLSSLEPRVAQLETLPLRIEELERRIEELEALCREQAGLQYLQFAAVASEAPAEAPFSQRRAK